MSSNSAAEHLALILAASQHAVTEDTLELLQDRKKLTGEPSGIDPHKPIMTARMFQALAAIEKCSKMFRPDFGVWLMNNWFIWERFSLEADRIWHTGRTHYGARTIIEFIRHETALREVNSSLKVNNSWVPDLGRLYGALNPTREDFFECRVMSDAGVRNKIRSRQPAEGANPPDGQGSDVECRSADDETQVGSLGNMSEFIAE